MNGHVDFWIDAYVDGELPVGLVSQVEKHLPTCEACRKLLHERGVLSQLLQQVPQAGPVKSEAQFVDDLNASLSKAPLLKPWLPLQTRERLADERFQFLAWTGGSLMILFASLFFQTIGLLEDILALIPGVHQEVLDQVAIAPPLPQLTLPDTVGSLLGQVRWLSLLDLNGLTNTLVLVLLSCLYIAWLAVWFVRMRSASISSEEQ